MLSHWRGGTGVVAIEENTGEEKETRMSVKESIRSVVQRAYAALMLQIVG
jgi:hypothetical protein